MKSQGHGDGEITEEQRKRAEANRLAALSKRKAMVSDNPHGHESASRFFKCRKLSSNSAAPVVSESIKPSVQKDGSCSIPEPKMPPLPVTETFWVRLEISSPNSFSLTPVPIPGVPYPGDEVCWEKLADLLSCIIPSHYTQTNEGRNGCVFQLSEYDMVFKTLKSCGGIKCDEIPWRTLNVVEKMSHSYASGKWIPCRPEHLAEEKVNELMQTLPNVLLDTLLPFQLEGVRFGLQRGGRCLIADEMGLGKTLQAIAIAGCFINEGPILIVCPAILRYSWAEELERWLPFCLPSDIHLVFGHRDNPAYLTKCPKVVVISYTMLKVLRKSMIGRQWATLIVDESHHLRCTKKESEPKEIKPVLDMAEKVKHLILLSGTPSLSRPFDIFNQINILWPGLLGKTKYQFAHTYCSVNLWHGSQGKKFQVDFSKGIRLVELNILLKQTVMIRRLKQHVMAELPPIRRKIIRLKLMESDIISAKATLEMVNGNASTKNDAEDDLFEVFVKDQNDNKESSVKLGDRLLGLAKLPGFLKWLSMHPIFLEFNCKEEVEESSSSHKLIVFAHHHVVLDRIQSFVCEKRIGFIRIDGNNPNPIDRKNAVEDFQSSNKVKIALIGILAGGSGLNLTAAQDVAILELPKETAIFEQAESRAHRIGQTKAVNIYIFCAKDTPDESRWQSFNDRLFRVSSTINGKYDAIHEIKVDTVSNLESKGTDERSNNKTRISAKSFEISQSQNQGLVKECADFVESIDTGNGSTQENYVLSSQIESLGIEKDIPSVSCEGTPRIANGTARKSCSHAVEHSEAEDQTKVNMVDEMDEDADGICEPNQNSSQLSSLRFEVSQHTGRIHLYSCIPGVDSRPQPLFQSFRPEEVELEDHVPGNGLKMINNCDEDYSYKRSALLRFLEEWKQLRPIEKKKLKGKPLQLPLSTELCFLDENLNHNKRGLLKGGSKRRQTPLHEISNPLPSNAFWKKVHLFSSYGKKEKVYTQGWSSQDEPLCKLCQKPCKNETAKKPEYFEDLFCNLGCYEEYSWRTSSRYLREALFQIEHGICTNCHLDCHNLVLQLKPLSLEKREQYIRRVAPKVAMRKKLFDKLVQDPTEGNAWHADHLVPVFQGGGECRLDNMRTLCVACHADVTAAQCSERRLAKEKAKRQLKIILNNLKVERDLENFDGKIKDQDQDQQQFDSKETMKDDLLVEVPGSAYSRTVISQTAEISEQKPSSG